MHNLNRSGKSPNHSQHLNQFSGNKTFQMNKISSYQKPIFSNQNAVGAQASSLCQPPSNCPQLLPTPPHPQLSDNSTWFMDSARLTHTFANDALNADQSDPMMRHSSPLISPTAKPQQLSNDAQDAQENRKTPRAIGTERASWKHTANHNETLDKIDNQHSLPPWILEKNLLQQAQAQQSRNLYSPQMAQAWKPFPEPRTQFPDDVHFQDQQQVSRF